MIKNNIFAVIVTYNPEIKSIENFIEKASNEFTNLILVDNNSENYGCLHLLCKKFQNIAIIKNEENYGIGAAQNFGINLALGRKATHIVFFDQDSYFESGFLMNLLGKYNELRASGLNIAAVGPALIDAGSKKSIPFISYKYGLKRRVVAGSDDVIKCYSLLSSGTLVSSEAIQAVGLFNEEYFIAYVDVEWCSRANYLGYSCYGVGSAVLSHNLGDSRYHLGKIVIPMHSPLRHYYVFRNGIFMLKAGYVPIYWKLNDSIQLFRSFLIYMAVGPSKVERLKMISKGIFDGIFNKKGKLTL